jgi:hypothetical protein
VHTTGYKVGDVLVGNQIQSHSVHYRGRLSPDGREIEGKWWIDADPELGSQRSEGGFTLARHEGPGPQPGETRGPGSP